MYDNFLHTNRLEMSKLILDFFVHKAKEAQN